MLPKPHGGKLVNRRLSAAGAAELAARAPSLPSLQLDPIGSADLQLIADGAFSPLTGFMGKADYDRVLAEMRLAKGTAWPLPITLAVGDDTAEDLAAAGEAVLKDQAGRICGLFRPAEFYAWSPAREAKLIYGTVDPAHPGAARLQSRGGLLAGGEVWAMPRPPAASYYTPAQTRSAFAERHRQSITGCHAGALVTRAQEYMWKAALEITDGLLLHAPAEPDVPRAFPALPALACAEKLLAAYFPAKLCLLTAMPGVSRYGGPREALCQALVGKNFGCTHYIIEHQGADGGGCAPAFAARDFLDYFGREDLGINLFFFDEPFYCRLCGNMATQKTCPHEAGRHLRLDERAARGFLARRETPPSECMRPEIAAMILEAMTAEGQPRD